MKRVLIIILIVLLVSLAATVLINGFKIGNFEVLGFSNLQKSSQDLENKIEQAKTLTSVTFKEKQSELSAAESELTTTKGKYQDKVAYSSEEDVRKANEIETYQVDFLFTRLGNHAKKYGLEIDLDAKLTQSAGIYDLNFTVHGQYIYIADFVSAVENDSDLTFTIEKFVLKPDNTSSGQASVDTLRAEFVVTGLRLDVDENIQNSSTIYVTSNESSQNSTSNASNSNSASSARNNTNTNTSNNTNQTSDVVAEESSTQSSDLGE